MVICFCHVSNINVNIQYSTSLSIITIFTIHSNTMSKKKEKSGDFESESGDREICSNLLKIANFRETWHLWVIFCQVTCCNPNKSLTVT